ncbi:hypothetical protein [Bacillus pinisoli]|uniref:hypothetical protein n=1 Tax=Bacillus pinisoli TaxID=2901866 RepID=UPI001FF510AE|nr:hypothetical protein [Bacillus pinisoli]
MKNLVIFICLISFLTGCQLLMSGPTQSDHNFHYPSSSVSHGVTPSKYEPNEIISTDKLLEERISGKINQAFSDQTIQVLVDRNRIIVSGVPTDDEQSAKRIRAAIGNMSHKRKLIIVEKDVFNMYKKAHENIN